MKDQKRIDRFKFNNNQISQHNANIAKAEIQYNEFVKHEESQKLARHADNIELYKKKHFRKKLIEKGDRYNYPHELLEEIRKISNRDPFDAGSISEEEILKFNELDAFVYNVECVKDENIKPNIALSLLINDGGEDDGA